MKYFSALIKSLDQTTKSNKKLELLETYFKAIPEQEIIYTVALFLKKRPPRATKTSNLKLWATELAKIPYWLFEESYHIVGDLAETIALLTEQKNTIEKPLSWWYQKLFELKKETESKQKDFIQNAWQSLDYHSRFVFSKLITGGFRIGVSSKTITKALAKHLEIEENKMAHLLLGNWMPQNTSLGQLLARTASFEITKPYPFFLAYALDKPITELNLNQWVAEYKWDGIRGQLINRKGEITLWSRGEEIISKNFPEIIQAAKELPEGTVLDGELLVWEQDRPAPFSAMQKRTNRKKPGKKILQTHPVVFLAYDLLEYQSRDQRENTYQDRRNILEKIPALQQHPCFKVSEKLSFNKAASLSELRENARKVGAEGLMLKEKASPYKVGRKKGWYKWKVQPYTIDAVLTYAMRGHGRRATLFTDYTFALWDNGELVTFAKAYSGLTDAEFAEVDKFIKANTLEKFGPVRQIKAELVFELAFEAIAPSNRHKSGFAVRFPRMLRWRKDKKPTDANTLEELRQMMLHP